MSNESFGKALRRLEVIKWLLAANLLMTMIAVFLLMD